MKLVEKRQMQKVLNRKLSRNSLPYNYSDFKKMTLPFILHTNKKKIFYISTYLKEF